MLLLKPHFSQTTTRGKIARHLNRSRARTLGLRDPESLRRLGLSSHRTEPQRLTAPSPGETTGGMT